MYVAIDIGGTNARIAAVEELTRVKPQLGEIRRVPILDQFAADFANVCSAIEQLINKKQIAEIRISIAGVVDSQGVKALGNLRSWENQNIVAKFRQQFNCEVKIANDAVCAALGESYYAGWEVKSLLFIVWGTGVGGCEVRFDSDKLLYYPFEPGWQLMQYKGTWRIWEQIAAGAGFKSLFGKTGDQLSEAEWEEVLDYMAVGLLNLSLVRPTDLIVLGGGVALKQAARVNKLSWRIQQMQQSENLPKIVLSRLGDEAGLYGALALHLL